MYKNNSIKKLFLTFLDKTVRKSDFFCTFRTFSSRSGLFSRIPDFERRTPGISDVRARSPEWSLGFWNSGLFSGRSASLYTNVGSTHEEQKLITQPLVFNGRLNVPPTLVECLIGTGSSQRGCRSPSGASVSCRSTRTPRPT